MRPGRVHAAGVRGAGLQASGELDGDPASSPLVEVTVDDEVLTGRAFGRVRRLWRDG